MLLYTGLFLASLCLTIASVYDFPQKQFRPKPSLILFVLSGLVVAVLFGLREGVGTDFNDVYVKGYMDISSGMGSRFEPGFVLLCRSLALLGFDYHALFFVTSFAVVFLVYRAIYLQSGNLVWGVFIFLFGGFLFFSTNGVRQALAVAILLNALPFATRSEPIKYAAVVAIAALFHSTALIFLPLYLLREWKPDSQKAVAVSVATVCLGGVIAPVLVSFGAVVSPQIARYVGADHLASRYLSSGNIDLSDLLICAMGLALFFFVRKEKMAEIDSHTVFLFDLMMVGVVICVLSAHVMIFSRLAVYFTPVSIVAIPRLFFCCADKKERKAVAIKATYLVFTLLVFIYLYGMRNFSHVVPYQTFL